MYFGCTIRCFKTFFYHVCFKNECFCDFDNSDIEAIKRSILKCSNRLNRSNSTESSVSYGSILPNDSDNEENSSSNNFQVTSFDADT